MYGSLRLPASSSRCDCPANIQSIKRWDLAAAALTGMIKGVHALPVCLV